MAKKLKPYIESGEHLLWIMWSNWMSSCSKMHIDPYLSPCISLKSKYIKDLTMNLYTFNLIEQKVGNSLELIGIENNFLNRTPIALTLRSRINKKNIINVKPFCKSKDSMIRIPIDWANIFTCSTYNRQVEWGETPVRGYREKRKGWYCDLMWTNNFNLKDTQEQ